MNTSAFDLVLTEKDSPDEINKFKRLSFKRRTFRQSNPKDVEMVQMNQPEQPETRQSLLGKQKSAIDFEKEQDLTQEKMLKQLFPELCRKDENRKTIFDKGAIDFNFLDKVLKRNKSEIDNIPPNPEYRPEPIFRSSILALNEEFNQKDEDEYRASNGLSYKELLLYIEENHPREDFLDSDGYIKKKPFATHAPLGSILFTHYYPESVLLPYGIGITLYFKYLKFTIYLFLLLFLLNIPAFIILIFNRNTITYHYDAHPFAAFLFSSTIGNLGESYGICSRFNQIQEGSNTFQSLQFFCPETTRLTEIIAVSLRDVRDCSMNYTDLDVMINETYADCKQIIMSNLDFNASCYHSPSCNLKFNISKIPDSCLLIEGDTPGNSRYIVGYAMCEDFEILFPGLNGLDKKDVYTLLIVLDLMTIAIYGAFYIVVGYKEKMEIDAFQNEKINPERFTICVEGFNQETNIYNFMKELAEHFQHYFSYLLDLSIVDMNIAYETENYINLRTKIGQEIEKLNVLEFLIQKAHNKFDFSSKLVRGLYQSHYKHKYLLDKRREDLETLETKTPLIIKYVFITFNSSSTCEGILHKFQSSPINQLLGLGRESWRMFHGKRIYVKKASGASNIQWRHLGGSQFSSTFRKYALKTLELIIIFASFYLLMYFQIQKTYDLELLNPTDCTKTYTPDDVAANWGDKRVLKCYCENTFRGTLEENLNKSKNATIEFQRFKCENTDLPYYDPFVYYQNHSLCYDYFEKIESLESGWNKLFMQFGMTLLICIVNGLVALGVMLLTKFMNRPTLSSEIKEAAYGVFLMQTINFGWLIFLAGLDSVRKIWDYYTPPSSSLFKAICQDYDIRFEGTSIFQMRWFLQNGTQLIVTFFTSGITYQIMPALIFALFKLYRWYDRGFQPDPRKTRKLFQDAYNKVYKGPMIQIDNSYSTLLTFITVGLMYSGGMPALYLLAALAMIPLYWVDKYLTFNFYSNPNRIDHRLVTKTQTLIPYAILFHLAFAILIFGSVGLAPPDPANYKLYLKDFIKLNVTITKNDSDGEKAINSFFSDIGEFYQNSLNLPYTNIYGYLTIILFAIISISLRLFILVPLRQLLDNMIYEFNILGKFRKLFRMKERQVIHEKFIEAIDDSFLKEKIKLMTQHDKKLPDGYQELHNEMLALYIAEFKERKSNPRYRRLLRGNPFYSMEFVEDLRKDFGLEYTDFFNKQF